MANHEQRGFTKTRTRDNSYNTRSTMTTRLELIGICTRDLLLVTAADGAVTHLSFLAMLQAV